MRNPVPNIHAAATLKAGSKSYLALQMFRSAVQRRVRPTHHGVGGASAGWGLQPRPNIHVVATLKAESKSYRIPNVAVSVATADRQGAWDAPYLPWASFPEAFAFLRIILVRKGSNAPTLIAMSSIK